MPYVDLHCDTLSALQREKRGGRPYSIVQNELHVDVKKLRKGDCLLQVFALFCNSIQSHDPLCDLLCQAQLFYHYIYEQSQLAPATDLPTVWHNYEQGRPCALLSLEDAGVCARDLSLLGVFYRLGVRIASLTWNHKNALGAPHTSEEGLTPTGFAFLEEAQRLGILIDLSHLSDRGVYDVLAHVHAPVIASHSNARSLCPHTRNLTDDMIAKIGACGGVIGINLYPPFLSDVEDKADLDAVCAHARHLCRIGGIDCVALGTDFDGFALNPAFADASHLNALPDALMRSGFCEDETKKILYGNALRVLREVL